MKSGTHIGREIISRYAACERYGDRGESVTTFAPTDGSAPRVLTISFGTEHDRDRGRFRFEYRARGLSKEKHCIIERERHGPARAWWNGAAGAHDLEALLSVSAGTSAGTLTLVPRLLLGRALPWTLGDAVRDGDAWNVPVDGREMIVWARASDLAIVRFTARHRSMELGDMLERGPRSENDAVRALYDSTIDQVVRYEPTIAA